MKSTILTTLAALLVSATARGGLKKKKSETAEDVKLDPIMDFDTFAFVYGREYKNETELEVRRQIYGENSQYIASQNDFFITGSSTFYAGVNNFTDLTSEVRGNKEDLKEEGTTLGTNYSPKHCKISWQNEKNPFVGICRSLACSTRRRSLGGGWVGVRRTGTYQHLVVHFGFTCSSRLAHKGRGERCERPGPMRLLLGFLRPICRPRERPCHRLRKFGFLK